jgi:hypothetical protein
VRKQGRQEGKKAGKADEKRKAEAIARALCKNSLSQKQKRFQYDTLSTWRPHHQNRRPF